MAESLQTVDVSQFAEDDEKLKKQYKQVTGYDGEVEGWTIANPVLVVGPYEQTMAIVIKLNSGDGAVRVFLGDRNINNYQTRPDATEEVIMVFLEPGHYCWLMEKAQAKCVK